MQLNLLSGQTEPLSLTFHQDPGHGWLEASLAHVRHLGLAGRISRYSYISRNGQTIYLEEDCDADLYVSACRAAGVNVAIKERHTNSDSFIRALAPFDPQQQQQQQQGSQRSGPTLF